MLAKDNPLGESGMYERPVCAHANVGWHSCNYTREGTNGTLTAQWGRTRSFGGSKCILSHNKHALIAGPYIDSWTGCARACVD
jgi:hypothetical protein